MFEVEDVARAFLAAEIQSKVMLSRFFPQTITPTKSSFLILFLSSNKNVIHVQDRRLSFHEVLIYVFFFLYVFLRFLALHF